jgi:DNA invertase Pin-like site-specific DNA recombinase
MKVGYARVSSTTQDHSAQVEALKAAGCQKIFSEKFSAKSTNGRRELKRMIDSLQPGDVVCVVKLYRIARSVRDLWNILDDIIEQKGAEFVSLTESWCDTTTDVGKLMITIMGGIAEFERSLIRSRCDEGIERAKARGTKFGRKAKLDLGERRRLAERFAKGESMADLAVEYEVSTPTVWRALRKAA